jgi:hypothetical protein
MAKTYPFTALRARIDQLAAEGRHAECEAATWHLAELTMRSPRGFTPHWRAAERRVPRLRYPVIEAN